MAPSTAGCGGSGGAGAGEGTGVGETGEGVFPPSPLRLSPPHAPVTSPHTTTSGMPNLLIRGARTSLKMSPAANVL